jgi:perosamine synthetase
LDEIGKFKMIPFARPNLGEEEAVAAREAIISQWVTQGPKVKQFEEEFANFVGASYACAVSSCTTALQMGLKVVGVGLGDVVITVSHSYIATANSVRFCGAEPVFVDIDPATYNMCPEALSKFLKEDCIERDGKLFYKRLDRIVSDESPLKFLTELAGENSDRLGRVAAILAVHQMGLPCEIKRIAEIAKSFRLPIIEDAACAIGSEVSLDDAKTWEKIGKPHGEIACFSFHPRKVITTGDGGMLTTNNSEYDSKFRLLRQHGMSVPDTVRHKSKEVIFEDYVTTGFNFRMTDIQAGVGIEQLKKLEGFVEERRNLAAKYEALLSDIPWLSTLRSPDTVRSNWQSYPVRLLQNAPLKQKAFMQYLLDNGVTSRRGIMNAHQEIPYAGSWENLKSSEETRDNVVLLPFFPGMTKEDLDTISNTIHKTPTC